MAKPPANAPLQEIGPWAPPAPARMAWLVVAAALTAAVLTAAAGWWAGGAIRPDDAAVTRAPVTRQLGAITVHAPARWTVAERADGAPRLEPGRSVAFTVDPASATLAVFSLEPAADATLLPAGLRSAIDGPVPEATPATLLGRPAWSYHGLKTRGRRTLDVTLLPTTAGVLASACLRDDTEIAGAADCAGEAGAVDLGGARTLTPRADLALRERLPAAIAALDARRVPLRSRLRAAATWRGQARIASRIARAYARTGARLAPVAPEGSRVLGALHRADVGYRRLARAAVRRKPGGFARARARITAAERALANRL